MFVFLSKKIGMPNNTKIDAICWNKEQGWVAVGGDKGLLKIMRLDDSKAKDTSAATKSSSLLEDHTLGNHTGSINCVKWNERYRKLTSVDDKGLIIVWMVHKDNWVHFYIHSLIRS